MMGRCIVRVHNRLEISAEASIVDLAKAERTAPGLIDPKPAFILSHAPDSISAPCEETNERLNREGEGERE